MRRLAVCLLSLAACGGKNSANEDGPVQPQDTATDSPIDQPVLPPCENPVNGTTVSTRRIGGAAVTISDAAVLVTAPAGDPRLFVVGRNGAIRIFDNETLLATPFIDLSDDENGPVLSGGEQGLLGLAFHPSYHTNGTFFVYYTKSEPADLDYEFRNVVARCTASATNPNTADPMTCVEILAIRDTFSNHNGGMIEFGKDGFLYIGTGDGGSGGDPHGNGQSLADGSPNSLSIALLGKLLRIDVDNPSGGKEYGIPADNPFVAGGGPPEVFALGLRNPWRWSFDSLTGDIWIGDVGQGPNPTGIEEINFVKAGELKGKNFGWDMFHGTQCFTQPCDATGKTPPVEQRSAGNPDNYISIIGGQVYRGTCYPDLEGTYFYTDFGAGGLASAKIDGAGAYSKQDLPGTFPGQVTSIHADARGELFITTLGGAVHRIEAGP